jgi:hypothetical protein
MKKILLFALVIAITTAFVIAAVQAPTSGVDTFVGMGRFCPNVGWNTSVCTAYLSDAPVQSVAFLVGPPVFTPNVGWNT